MRAAACLYARISRRAQTALVADVIGVMLGEYAAPIARPGRRIAVPSSRATTWAFIRGLGTQGMTPAQSLCAAQCVTDRCSRYRFWPENVCQKPALQAGPDK